MTPPDNDNIVEGTEAVTDPATSRTVVTDPDVLEDELAVDDAVPAVTGDAKPDDGIVRTNRPDTPIADVLGVGAGAPKPRTPGPLDEGGDGLDRDGRPIDNPDTVSADYDGPGSPGAADADADDATVGDTSDVPVADLKGDALAAEAARLEIDTTEDGSLDDGSKSADEVRAAIAEARDAE